MGVGPVELGFQVTARRYSAIVRPILALGIEAASLLVTPRRHLPLAVAVLVAVALWSAVMVFRLIRGRPTWVLVVDTAVLSVVCLLQPLLEVPALSGAGSGWLQLAVECGLIAQQWQFDRRPALAATGVVAASFAVGGLLTGQQSTATVLLTSLWLVVTAGVSRLVATSSLAAGRQIDAVLVEDQVLQQEAEVARARREAQAEHLATLHDTVASTLLMVGLGAARNDPAGLREQATRDLAVLTAQGPRFDADIGSAVREVAADSPLDVAVTVVGPVTFPPGEVTAAFAGAVGEALRNVARHAGVAGADLTVDTRAGVLVEVRDQGPGFGPQAEHGRGIRFSISERMQRCGGRARVTSSAEGVRVRLEWLVESPGGAG